jgi:hypothetical protein
MIESQKRSNNQQEVMEAMRESQEHCSNKHK